MGVFCSWDKVRARTQGLSKVIIPDVHTMMYRCICQHNPTKSRALRNFIHPWSTALTTNSVTPTPEMKETPSESSGFAFPMECMLIESRRSSKYSLHHPFLHSVEVTAPHSHCRQCRQWQPDRQWQRGTFPTHILCRLPPPG